MEIKIYEIRWALHETDTEWVAAENPEEAVKRFRNISLNRLLGTNTNVAEVLRIIEVKEGL